MKHILLIILLVFSFSITQAQVVITVTQQEKPMSRGVRNGFITDVPQARLKDIVNAWKKYIKRGDKPSSVDKNGDEYTVTGSVLSNISANPMSVYASIKEVDNGIRVTAFFMEEDSAFIAGTTEKAASTEKLLRDFARAQYHLAVEGELNNENKKLAALGSDEEDLIKDNEKSNKNINEYQRKIDRTQNDIEANDAATSKRRDEVANQKEVVRSVPPKTDAYDVEDKKLSGLEKELKKLQKDGESLHKDIDDHKDNISKEKRNIEKTDDRIKDKKEAIAKQKDHVKEVREKMEGIK